MPERPKDGTVVGEIRAPIDVPRLLKYLEGSVEGFAGPLTIKQFGVSFSFVSRRKQVESRVDEVEVGLEEMVWWSSLSASRKAREDRAGWNRR